MKHNTPAQEAKSLGTLFFTFFKIGLFTFGGGYAMIALLEEEFIQRRKWLDKDEFLDMTAIAESTPGPVAINSATYLGYKLAKVPGAATAAVAASRSPAGLATAWQSVANSSWKVARPFSSWLSWFACRVVKVARVVSALVTFAWAASSVTSVTSWSVCTAVATWGWVVLPQIGQASPSSSSLARVAIMAARRAFFFSLRSA